MRDIHKILVVLAGALAITAGSCDWRLPQGAVDPFMKEPLRALASAGASVALGSRVTFRMLPRPTFEIDAIAIANPAPASPRPRPASPPRPALARYWPGASSLTGWSCASL